MSSVLAFDELNALEESRRSEPYDQYFDKMSLTDKEKELRIAFSEDMEDAILYILSLAEVMIENDQINKEYIQNEMYSRYIDIAESYVDVDTYVEDYIKSFSGQLIETTFELYSDPYYLSKDRAMFISECESNSILNYKQYVDALKQGKKFKTWVDIRDKRERKTHLEVGGKTIPIKELFTVGNSLMLFPKDISRGAPAKETVNCRCSVRYS